jgi:hypothetical protein
MLLPSLSKRLLVDGFREGVGGGGGSLHRSTLAKLDREEGGGGLCSPSLHSGECSTLSIFGDGFCCTLLYFVLL